MIISVHDDKFKECFVLEVQIGVGLSTGGLNGILDVGLENYIALWRLGARAPEEKYRSPGWQSLQPAMSPHTLSH